MKIEVVSLFPKMFEGVLAEGVLGRAVRKKIVKVKIHDMRQWAWNNYGAVDDRPFGGGAGMIIRADVVGKAIEKILRSRNKFGMTKKPWVVALSAKGKRFNQETVERLAGKKKLVLLCGRYEGFDQRTLEEADEVLSVGDFVLSGGEIAAMAVIDAVVRLKKGVLGKDESSHEESFSEIEGKRGPEYAQYTRPQNYKGKKVPVVLISGDHKKIKEWRKSKQGVGKK
ncbi:tRNA (guanosine(37)-N1)-methyltransferase TrmD [Patescibacteria group bacterium]|nr:tRNA (guanosine(37)-N1)-methyltransferase TrmD [Patescibacteria group bacterium]